MSIYMYISAWISRWVYNKNSSEHFLFSRRGSALCLYHLFVVKFSSLAQFLVSYYILLHSGLFIFVPFYTIIILIIIISSRIFFIPFLHHFTIFLLLTAPAASMSLPFFLGPLCFLIFFLLHFLQPLSLCPFYLSLTLSFLSTLFFAFLSHFITRTHL